MINPEPTTTSNDENASEPSRSTRAIIYARLSRDSETGLSIPAQIREGKEYAKKLGFNDVTVVIEEKPVSASVPFADRDGGCKVVKLIASGNYGQLIIRERSRATRDLEDSIRFRHLLVENEVTLHTADGPVALASPANRFTENVAASFDQYEKEICSDRQRKAKKQKASMGQHVGGPPPFGYQSQTTFAKQLRDQGADAEVALGEAQTRYPLKGHLYPSDAEAPIVKKVFSLYIDERLGCRAIAKTLNQLGCFRRSGLRWCPDKIRRIINDPVVAGYIPFDEVRYARGGTGPATPKHLQHRYPGKHEPIVTPKIWEQVQAIKNGNRCKVTGVGDASASNQKYPLSGVLRCRCGSAMKAVGSNGHRYLVCYKRRDYGTDDIGGCDGPRVDMKKAEVAFWGSLHDLLGSPELVDAILGAAASLIEGRSEQEDQGPTAHQQLAKIVTDIERWFERHDVAKTDVEREIAHSRLVSLTERKKELQSLASDERAVPPSASLLLTRDEVERYMGTLGEAIERSKDKGCGLVQLLAEHHALRVELLDDQTLLISMRFRPPGSDDDEAASVAVPLETVATLPKGEIDRWIDEHQGQHNCAICGESVEVLRRHYWHGIPQHHHKCWASQLTAKRSNPEPDRYYNGTQVASLFGVGSSTVGRWTRSGKLPEPTKVSGVNLYAKDAIDGLLGGSK